MKSLGLDISLNHGAAVEIVDGEAFRHWFYTSVAGVAAIGGERVPDEKSDDRHQRGIRRLDWIARWLESVVRESAPDYAGLEDYAIRAQQGAHYLGEVGGIARACLWRLGVRFRLHDPTSLKLYVAHDGSADKELVRIEARERWGVEFNYTVGKNALTSEDLTDAYVMAKLVEVEARIRSGELSTRDLEHDQERRVFNRTTKTNPTNVLDRGWIWNQGVDMFPSCGYSSCALAKLEADGAVTASLSKKIVRRYKRGKEPRVNVG